MSKYDCSKCPAYCCSYEKISIEPRDLKRLAKHFDLELDSARRRFTRIFEDERVLRHRPDETYGSACMFLDPKTRQCTVYEARPDVCKEYPDKPRCGYYEFLRWERDHQDDQTFIPLSRGGKSPSQP